MQLILATLRDKSLDQLQFEFAYWSLKIVRPWILDQFQVKLSLSKRLLEAMNYSDVEVTTRPGDGGVDVIAEIEHGITWVREVVQAKRHRHTVPRKNLDALRGSLYRFNAVRGTIITTSKFSKGTVDAAVASGTVPITLIDGARLVDLLVEHGIGVKKRNVELLDVDEDALAQSDFDE